MCVDPFLRTIAFCMLYKPRHRAEVPPYNLQRQLPSNPCQPPCQGRSTRSEGTLHQNCVASCVPAYGFLWLGGVTRELRRLTLFCSWTLPFWTHVVGFVFVFFALFGSARGGEWSGICGSRIGRVSLVDFVTIVCHVRVRGGCFLFLHLHGSGLWMVCMMRLCDHRKGDCRKWMKGCSNLGC